MRILLLVVTIAAVAMGSNLREPRAEDKMLPLFMHSLFGQEYFIEVYAGYLMQKFHLIPDIQGDHTWFARGDCFEKCHYKTKYDMTDDAFITWLGYSDEIKGEIPPDVFEIKCNQTTNHFTMMKKYGGEQLITMQACMAYSANLQTYYADGVVAFSLASYYDQHDHNLLYRLMQDEIVTEPMVGMFFDYFMGSGNMTVGGFDNNFVDPAKITWLDTQENNKWALKASYIKVGEHTRWSKAILYPDTRVKYIAVPENIYYDFQASLPCDPYICFLEYADYNAFPKIELTVNDGAQIMTIVPQDYVTFVPYLGNQYRVVFTIRVHDLSNWILGTDFLKQFYQVYDYSTKKMAMYPLANDHYGVEQFQ